MTETIPFGMRGGEQLLSDLHLPSNGTSGSPLIVAVSGGGWRRGNRQSLAKWGTYFAQQGMAFASVDYARAVTGPAWPENASDVAAAISYFSANGDEHGVDPTRICVLGVSAGAHLGALALLSDAFETPPVCGFAGIYGVYDLMAHWQHDLAAHGRPGEDLTERMIGCTPFGDPQRFHDASPLRQITYAKSMPVFLSWGHADREVSPQQSAAFATALQQAGYAVRCREFDDAGHFWFSEEDPLTSGNTAAKIAPDLTLFFRRAFEHPAALAPAAPIARAAV